MQGRGVAVRAGRPGLALAAAVLLASAGAAAGQPGAGGDRLALVMGNSAYTAVSPLPNPQNDAADVGAALARLGFDVTTLLDGDRAGMDEALRAFARRSVGASAALIFYAGHGMEVDGVNYLLPVDARLESDTDVEYETVDLDRVLRATEGAGLRMVILDACRDNPLAQTMRRVRATRSISRGSFGDLDEQQLLDETLVAYAAAAGTTAADGVGRNSPYTEALLAYLEQPLEISALFRRVRRASSRRPRGASGRTSTSRCWATTTWAFAARARPAPRTSSMPTRGRGPARRRRGSPTPGSSIASCSATRPASPSRSIRTPPSGPARGYGSCSSRTSTGSCT